MSSPPRGASIRDEDLDGLVAAIQSIEFAVDPRVSESSGGVVFRPSRLIWRSAAAAALWSAVLGSALPESCAGAGVGDRASGSRRVDSGAGDGRLTVSTSPPGGQQGAPPRSPTPAQLIGGSPEPANTRGRGTRLDAAAADAVAAESGGGGRSPPRETRGSDHPRATEEAKPNRKPRLA